MPPSRPRARLVALARLLVLLVVGVFVAALVARRDPGHAARPALAPASTASTASTAADEPAGIEPAPPPAPAAAPARGTPHRATHATGQRTLVPHPVTPPASAGAAPLVPRLQRGGELKDRRGGPHDEEQRQQVMAAMGAVEDDVEECLHAWSEVEPDLHGEVSLAFQIDDSGLGKVWIQDWADVPEGPMTCFASAVYGVDWSHISDKPIEISNHFVVEQGAPAQVNVRGPEDP
jgi:hypothetical protein